MDYTDPQLLAALSHDMSGLFAAAAQVYEGTALGQCLGDASRAWGRGGQTYHGRGYRTPSALGHAARVLTSRNVNELVLAIDILLILLDLARQIARFYEKQKQVQTASYLLKSTQAVNYRVDGVPASYNPWLDKWRSEALYEHVFSGSDQKQGSSWQNLSVVERVEFMGRAAGSSFKVTSYSSGSVKKFNVEGFRRNDGRRNRPPR